MSHKWIAPFPCQLLSLSLGMHGCLKYLQRKEIGFCVIDTAGFVSLTYAEYFLLFANIEIFIVFIELFIVWCFMQNDIINIKIINVVTPEMICFDHIITVAKHYFRILLNVFITLYSLANMDMGHLGWHLKRWNPTNSPTVVLDINYNGTKFFCLWWMYSRYVSKEILIFPFHWYMKQVLNRFLDISWHSWIFVLTWP